MQTAPVVSLTVIQTQPIVVSDNSADEEMKE